MNELKILYVDLLRHVNIMKADTKEMGKEIDSLLGLTQWESIEACVNDIDMIAQRIKAYCANVRTLVDNFLINGPYEGQRAGVTPLESLAGKEE